MTIKYLLMFPTYCKHSDISVDGPCCISGTFLLADAKMRGSAVRALGPSDVGAGFAGELDMRIRWVHTGRVDPPPKRRLQNAMAQVRGIPALLSVTVCCCL